MPYDRDSFLAGLAAGRMTWQPPGSGGLNPQPASIYLKFSCNTNFFLTTNTSSKTWDGILEYSRDRTTWTQWDGTTTLTSIDGKLYLRGKNNTYITGGSEDSPLMGFNFTARGGGKAQISCSGNIETLLDYELVQAGIHPQMAPYAFSGLFVLEDLVSVPILPAITLSEGCYYNMFGASNLITAPALPATRLAKKCYERMFHQCASLINAPSLPALTLEESCYKRMFEDCTALVNAPTLPATYLAPSCYQYMFRGDTSLVDAPALSANWMYENCYAHMFQSCSSLTNLPVLPATRLAPYCYYEMFENCPSIAAVPQLPALQLEEYCYASMFDHSVKGSYRPVGVYQYQYRIPTSGTGVTAHGATNWMFDGDGMDVNIKYYIDRPVQS